MATVKVTAENFAETVDGEGITLLDFWATWCGPCRSFAPIFERVSERHPDITFAKIDTDAEQMLSSEFKIRSIPTVMAVRDGIVVFSQPGALPERALESLIEQVRALDMDDVRAKTDAAAEKAENAEKADAAEATAKSANAEGAKSGS
jgi:thioredoxin 1